MDLGVCLEVITSRIAAMVELALVGVVLGDVGQPHLVGGLDAEQTLYEVVMDRRSSPRFLFVGNEPVPETGVIGMDFAGRVDRVRLVPISLQQELYDGAFGHGMAIHPFTPVCSPSRRVMVRRYDSSAN